MLLEKKNNIPLYLQLMSIFIENIRKGVWAVGEKLPSEKELSVRYGVSLITVRKALEELNKENMIYKVQGKGSFVSYAETERYNLRFRELKSFTKEMQENQKEVGALVLSAKQVPADCTLAKLFSVEEGTPMFRITRLRTVDGVPTHVSTSTLRMSVANRIKGADFSQSIYSLLQRAGYHLTRGTEEIIAAFPTREEAEYLGINQNTPILDTRNIVEDQGKPIMYTKSIINSNRMKITVNLSKEE